MREIGKTAGEGGDRLGSDERIGRVDGIGGRQSFRVVGAPVPRRLDELVDFLGRHGVDLSRSERIALTTGTGAGADALPDDQRRIALFDRLLDQLATDPDAPAELLADPAGTVHRLADGLPDRVADGVVASLRRAGFSGAPTDDAGVVIGRLAGGLLAGAPQLVPTAGTEGGRR